MSNTSVKTKFKNVLLIEDDPTDLYIAKRVIEKGELCEHINIVESAEDALIFLMENEKYPQNIPDLILLDLNMRDMNGIEFLDKFDRLAFSIRQRARIMVLTNFVQDDKRNIILMHRNVLGILDKPLLPKHLPGIRFNFLKFEN